MPTIEETIGATPLIELRRSLSESARDRGNLIFGKWECVNPSASIKDRVVKSMIDEAEASGTIHPGDTLIEASKGNTGIALAMQAANAQQSGDQPMLFKAQANRELLAILEPLQVAAGQN